MDRTTFLESVHNHIKLLAARNPGRPVLGSALGNALKRSGLDWRPHGFLRLSDALVPLEADGRVRTGPFAPHPFAVWLADGSSLAPTSQSPPDSDPSPSLPTRPMDLRRDVWEAFVSERPSTSRWFDRESGAIVYCESGDTTPKPSMVSIPSISRDIQRGWAESFLTKSGLDGNADLREQLGHDRWFVQFPMAVERIDPSLARAWKAERSRHVLDAVRAWCTTHDILPQKIFTPASPPTVRHPFSRWGSTSTSGTDLRTILLKTIAGLSTDELLAFPIPARSLIVALRPDLLPR